MADKIDELSIEIVADSEKASEAIHKLTADLNGLSLALNRINTNSISKFARSFETLATIGKRTDMVADAVDRMSKKLDADFGIRTREGIDAVSNSMMHLAEANKRFFSNVDDMKLGDALENARSEAISTVESYARIKKQIDDTSLSVKEFVAATNKGTRKISLSDVAAELGDNLSSVQKTLGSNFTSSLSAAAEGVSDLEGYLEELSQQTGYVFQSDTLDSKVYELAEVLQRAKNETLSYNEAVRAGQIDQRNASFAIGDYQRGLEAIIDVQGDLKTNGIDAIVDSFTKLSDIRLPDFTSFANAVNALNKVSTTRVVNNINAVKQALEETQTQAVDLNEKLTNISFDIEGNPTGFVTDLTEATQKASTQTERIADVCRIAQEQTANMANSFYNVDEAVNRLPGSMDAFQESIENVQRAVPEVCEEMEDIRRIWESLGKGDTLDAKMHALANEFKAIEPYMDKPRLSLEKMEAAISKVQEKALALGYALNKVSSTLDKIGNIGISAFKGIANGIKNVVVGSFNVLKEFGSYLGRDFQEHFESLHRSFQNFGSAFRSELNNLSRFWQRTMRTFTFMLVRKGITAIISDIKECVDELVLFEKHLGNLSGGKFNNSVSEIIADFHLIARAIVAAFEPLINAVVPMINAVSNAIANALATVGEFFAAFTGQNYFVKARKTVVDYAGSLEDAEDAAEDTKKAEDDDNDTLDEKKEKIKEIKKMLLGIDELNILPKQDEDDLDDAIDKAKDKAEKAAKDKKGKTGGINYKDAFEEIPVSDAMKGLVDKIKSILKDLWQPMKDAWDQMFPYLKQSWQYMGQELWALAKSIGSAFLEVWKQPETVEIFKNLLGIVGDLMNVVGNLAHNFRDAWDSITNNGKRLGVEIFENLRDIIAIIIQHVRNVTQYMMDWSSKINFKPLLNGINDVLAALIPVADFLGGVFEDVMKNIVLEHIRWLIEEGIPHLCHAIEQISKSFDWDKLRSQLQPVEKTFERMTQQIHTGIINAMENLGVAIGQWTQTENFQKFLDGVEHFMSKITAERVEKLFTGLGMGILKVAQGIADFIGSEKFENFIDEVFDWYDSITAEDISKWFEGISDGIWKIIDAIGLFVTSDTFKQFMTDLFEWYSSLTAEDISKFFEAIGDSILKVADALKQFVESPEFKSFIKMLGDWWANTDATELANGIKLVAGAIIAFKFTAFIGEGLAGFITFIGTIKGLKDLSTIAKGLTAVGTGAQAAGAGAAAAGTGTATAAAGLGTVAALAAGATADLVLVGADFYNLKNASDTYAQASQTHSSEVETAINSLAKVYEEKGPEIAAEWAKTVYDVDISGDDLTTAQQKVANKIDQLWSDTPQNMWDGFQQGWDSYFGKDGTGLMDLCGDAFEQLIGGIKGVLGIASPSTVFSEIGSNTVEGYNEGFTTAWGTASPLLGLVDAFITAFGEKFSNIGETIGTALEPLKTAMQTKADEAKTAAVEKLSALSTEAGTAFETLRQTAETKFNEVKTSITSRMSESQKAAVADAKKIATDVAKACKEVAKAGLDHFKDFEKSAKEKFGDAKRGIGEKMNESITLVGEKLDKIKDRFQKLNLEKMGTNVVKGFLGGLKSAWAQVQAWAAQAVAEIKAKFAEALQIRSPSKVFEQYGKYTVEGFNLGLVEAGKTTSDAIDKWVDTFSDMTVSLVPEFSTDTTGLANTILANVPQEDFKSVVMSAADKIISSNRQIAAQRGETRLIVELDGRRIYEEVVQQDRRQLLRTGRSSFAY